jgi:hypothetical protein
VRWWLPEQFKDGFIVELPKCRPIITARLDPNNIPPTGDFDSAPEFVDAEEPDSDISDGCRRVEPQMYAEGAVTTCANRTLALEIPLLSLLLTR